MSKSEWEDKSIDTTFEQNVAVADVKFVKYPVGKYDISNPHPGYGVDPNIMNEFGHTIYPKFVGDKIVNSAHEEMELTGKQPEENPAVKNSPWK